LGAGLCNGRLQRSGNEAAQNPSWSENHCATSALSALYTPQSLLLLLLPMLVELPLLCRTVAAAALSDCRR
jgi:hypothetical protein